MPEKAQHLIDVLAKSLDLDDPTPIYHQLAAVVRWEVAKGRLAIGAMLPPVRDVAAAVGVNYHTVRRAWGDLEAEGVLDIRRGRGARVIRAAASPALSGWRPGRREDEGEAGDPVVWVANAWLERAARLATRLGERWRVSAVPYPAGATAPPPPGPILLLGHPDGGALPWPSREGDTTAIEPVLDPETVAMVRRNARILTTDEVLLVSAEGDPAQPVQDLLRQLPRVGLRTRQHMGPAVGVEATSSLWLYLPVAWRQLDWQGRSLPQAMAVEFDWAPGPLAGVARRLDWRERSP